MRNMSCTISLKCSAGLSLPVSGGRGSNRSDSSSCRSLRYVRARDSLNNKVRANKVLALSTLFGASRIIPSANNSTPRHVTGSASSIKLVTEESYDDAAAPPMHYQLGSLIEPEEPCVYDGGYDYESNAFHDWEEMTGLLSFDGEEHKYVTRHIPGTHLRVEDMFASFDGDDFEAVMTAARGCEQGTHKSAQETGSILAAAGVDATAAKTAADPATHLQDSSSLDSSDEPEDLYLAVTRRRAAGLAAEAQQKKNPKPKKRKAPLGTEAGDAWMFQVPVTVAGQPKFLSQEQYVAAQRALLPPLAQQGGACTADAAFAAAQQQQVAGKATEVVVVVQRPEESSDAAPAPHAAQQQTQQTAQALTYPPMGGMCSGSDGCRHAAAALEATAGIPGWHPSPVRGNSSSRVPGSVALPAAAAPEGLLGLTAGAAATVATHQVQPGDLRRGSSRVLAAPALVAPLPAATVMMGAAAGVAGVGAAIEADAAMLDVKSMLLTLPSCNEDCHHEAVTGRAGQGAGGAWTGLGEVSVLASSSNASAAVDDVGAAVGAALKGAVAMGVNGVYSCASVKRQVGKLALRRALSKLKGGLI